MNKEKIVDILVYIFLIIVAILVLLPVTWIVISSLQPGSTLFSSSFVPKGFTVEHYIRLLTKTPYPLWFKNTLIIAILNTVISVIITTLTAYIFSRYRFKGREEVMKGVLILQMFPSFLAMTAIYALLKNMNLTDNIWGLILVYTSGQIPFNAWLAKGYFDAIPASLDEAARVDGAPPLTIFTKVIMPLARPIMVFIAIVNFSGPWFDFIFPKLLLRSAEKKTLAVGIFEWIQTRADNNFTVFAAGAILIAVPITLLFLLLQKHIVSGLSQGATKG